MNHNDNRTCKYLLKDEICTRTVSLINKTRRKKRSYDGWCIWFSECLYRSGSKKSQGRLFSWVCALRGSFFSSLAHTFIPCVEIFFSRVQTFLVGRDFLLWVEYVSLAGFELIFQSCLVKNLINENLLVLVYHEVSHGRTWGI